MDTAVSTPSRVLAMRLDKLGDLLMTTPALAAPRGGTDAAPGRAVHLTWLTSPSGAAAAPWLQQPAADEGPLGEAEALGATTTDDRLRFTVHEAARDIAEDGTAVVLAGGAGDEALVQAALTNPQHTPWRVAPRVLYQDVPCRWCLKCVCPQGHHACLLGVPAPRVAQAAIELMRLPRGPRAQPAAALETAA